MPETIVCINCKREIPKGERTYKDSDGNEPACLTCMTEIMLEMLVSIGLLEKRYMRG